MTIAGLGLALSFSSCKRVKELLDPNIEQHNEDSNDLKTEMDQIDDDINDVINDMPGFGKTDETDQVFSSAMCGATVDTSEIDQNILYFNFDGTTPCFSPSRTRSGQIKVELTGGDHWYEAGAQLTQTFTDFKITRLSDDRSIEFDGVRTLENVNGYDWWEFLQGNQNILYRARMVGMDVTFDNNQTALWSTARTAQWAYTPNANDPDIPVAYLTFTANGDTAIDGHANTDSWGVNRYGSDFVSYLNSAVTSNSYCGYWRPILGEWVHEVDNNEYTLTLGVDQEGNVSTLDCAYGYKVAWEINGEANEQVFSY